MLEITKNERKLLVFNATSAETVLPFYSNTATLTKPGYRNISQSTEIKNLAVTVFIENLTLVNYPTFELEISESQKAKILLDLQWTSSRIHLNEYLNIDDAGNKLIEIFSLLSPSPYPYSKSNIDNIPLGDNSVLLFGLQDVGYGILSGDDKVVISGDIVSHYFLEKISEGNVIENSITTIAALVIPENANRSGFTIRNTSDANVYLDIVPAVSLTSHLARIKSGGYYETPPFFTSDNIYMITDSLTPVSIQIREFT